MSSSSLDVHRNRQQKNNGQPNLNSRIHGVIWQMQSQLGQQHGPKRTRHTGYLPVYYPYELTGVGHGHQLQKSRNSNEGIYDKKKIEN
eukprot:scaffold60578_cov21-Prasinocladus_malaysianus.AAC.1